MELQTRHVYRFGNFSLDATTKVLLRNGEPMRLARKAVETLLVFLEHPDQVLTKEELLGAIWQGRIVDEANLMQNVAVVRKTLQVLPGQAGHIETFPGRGYRLIGPILEGEESLHGPEHFPAPQPVAPPVANPVKFPFKAWGVAAGALLIAAAIWMGYSLQKRSEEKSAPDFKRSAVARMGGKEFQPAISADGSNVAFAIQPADRLSARIWVRTAGRERPYVLGKTGWEYASPAWAPDGKWLAFLRFSGQGGELVIAAPDGSKERVLSRIFQTRFGLPYHHLDWSADGRWLAVDDTASAEEPFGIFEISAASGERRRVTTPPVNSLGDMEPRFSPDGESLSFIRVFHRARQALFVTPLNGGVPRQLSRDVFQVSGQDWADNRGTVVMASNESGEFRLWRVHANEPAGRAAADPTGIYADEPIQIAAARRGHALLYSVLREDSNIWRLDLNGQKSAGERWTPIINSSAQDASPQYSPDGSEICFRSDRTGEEQLWVASADGSNLQQATRGKLRPSVGRWAPAGNALVFNDSREGDLYIVARDHGGNWESKAVGARGTHPVFSADGKWIYAGYEQVIFKVPAAGGAPATIAAVHGLSFGLSPDGKSLFFVRSLVDSSLWALSLTSGEISKVLYGLVPYCTSCWAAGAKGIYYLGDARAGVNKQSIYLHDLATGENRVVADYPEPLRPLGSGPFSLSPDGRYLLCVRVDLASSDVMRIEPYR